MTPLQMVQKDFPDATLTDSTKQYQLISYKENGIYLGVIYRLGQTGWRVRGKSSFHSMMVTCFYNLTRD
jgi:hypothetical protein